MTSSNFGQVEQSKSILHEMFLELISFIEVYKRAEDSKLEIEEIQAVIQKYF
jgi:hypothetical protein